MFSNVWRLKVSDYLPPAEIEFKLAKLYEDLLTKEYVDWNASYATLTKEDIFRQSLADVCTIMDSHNQNYFLNTKSEVSIDVALQNGVTLTVRLDFIHNDAVSWEALIFDGKGTDKIGKNIFNHQLYFYALLYFISFKKMPESLGFFYYKLNLFQPIEFDTDILKMFKADLAQDIEQILADTEFKATPCPKSCQYCEYKTVCQEHQEYEASHRRESKLNLPNSDGLIDIGF